MAVAGCINAYDCAGCFLTTFQQLQSDNIGVSIDYTAPSEYGRRQLDYIKYTDKCGCTCCLTGENELRIVATQGVIKNFTLTNDDTNEVVKVKWNDLFGSNRAYTMVRYKTGSYPTSITDGTLAVKETTQNQYATNGYNVSGLTDGTTYYFTAFAVSQDGTIIVVQNKTITPSYGYVVNANTLLYVKNDGDISDYSQYKNNHSMNWSGTQSFETLSTGRKVASFNGSNAVYCTRFAEGIGKTAFTMHLRIKNKVNYSNTVGGRRDRNVSGPSTTDKRGLGIFADNSTKQYPSYGAYDWQSATIGINTDTSAFYLYTATINGRTVNIYKNALLVGTRTGSYNIIGGSNTGGKFFYGGHVSYTETSMSSGSGTQMYVGEIVVEDKVQSAADIQTYYDKVRKRYRPQLQMYRPLISNATDQSTYSRNGTVNGTVSWNNGAVFSGSGNISSGMNDMPPSFTISCWVKKPSSSTSEQVLFAKWGGTGTNSLQRFGMHFNGSNMLKVYQGVSTSSHNWVDVMTFNTSDWYNVVYTYKNGTVKVYVDAVLKNSFSFAFNNSTSNSMNIGGWSSSQSNLTGTMREFTIEEGERSQSDVSVYFQSTKSTFGK